MTAPGPSDPQLEDVLHRICERLHRIHEDLFLVAGEVSLLRGLIETQNHRNQDQ